MSNTKKVPLKPTTASRIPTTGRDSGTHSRSSSISNLTSVSDTKSDAGDAVPLEKNAPEFRIGERVWVNGTKPGVLKFLGNTQFALGAWAGVVLDEPAGKNDGSVDGVRYFQCESKKGIFARPHKLTRVAGSPPSIGDSPSVGAVCRPQTPDVSSRPLTLANVSSVTPKVCSRLRLGERVYVNSTTGVKTGILRYIGVTDFAKGDWAGIELDQPLGKNDGSVANKRYFTCKAKHGLFSPLHKVSHAGGTPRTPSTLGSRMRSDSRESLNSSISSCSTSRGNRVKLGVTSLTNTQKMLRGSGAGIMTNSRALEETIKEKEQHIEELLKERELERTEVARATNQYLEAERKLLEFKENDDKQSQFKNLYEKAETERKKLEGQTFDDKRKLEDLQFQLEEEAIAKGDLEIQLQQKHYVLKKLEDFANRELGENSYRMKEILKGQEYQGGDTEHFSSSETEINSQRIFQLEADLQSAKNEKLDFSKEIEQIQEKLSNYELAKEEKELQVSTLNSNLQEKDLFIHKLKDELNSSKVKIDSLSNEIEKLNVESVQQKAQDEEKNNFIQDSKEKYLKEIEDVRDQLSISSAAREEKQLVVSSLNKEVQDKDLCIQKLKGELISFEEKIAHLSQQIEDLNVEAEKQKVNSEKVLNDVMEKFKKQMEDSEMKDGTITDIKELLSSVNEQLSRKDDDFINLECELNDFKSKNQSLTEEKEKTEAALQEQLNNSLEKFQSLMSMNQQQIEDVKLRDVKITDFERELSAVKDQLQEKESIFIKIEAELNEFKFKYQSLVKEKEDADISMQQQLQKNSEKVESLMSTNQKQIEESQRKDATIVDFEGQLSSVKGQLNNKNEELRKLDFELNQLKSQLQSLSREKEEIEETRHQQLKDAFEKFEILTSSKQQEVDTLQDEIRLISELGKERDKLLSEKESEKMELEAAVEGKEKTIAELSQKLKQTEDELHNVTSTFSEQVNLLQNEISSEKDKFANISKELEQEVEKLQAEVMRLAELEKQQSELLLKKDNENAQLVQAKEENERTISQTNQRLKEVEDKLKEVKDEYTEQVLLLQSEIASEKEKFEAANKDFEETLSKSTSENQSLHSAYETSLQEKEIELREVVDISNTLQLKLEQKDLQVKELESELFHSKQQIEILSKDKTEGQSLLQKQLTEMRSKTEAELKVKYDRVQALQNEVKVLSQLEENRNKQILEINDLNSRLSNEVEENKEKFAQASLKLRQTQEEFQTLKDDCSVRNSAYEKEMETEKDRFNSMKSELEQKWSELDALNAEMGKNLESKDLVIKNYKESTESLQNNEKRNTLQIDELESQLNNLKQQFEIANQDKSEAQISMQNQLNDLINKKEADEKLKDNTIEELKKQFAKLSETSSCEMKERESELILLRNTLQEKELQCVKLSETINSAEKECLQLRQQNDSNLSLLESKESHIKELTCEQEKDLLQKDKTIEQLTSDLAQLSESNESKSSKMGGKELEILQLRSILQEKESQFDQLTEMITSSQEQLLRLKRQLDSNLALLQSKEKYIEEFRSDQDKLLLQKEQLFKDEMSTLKASLTDKEASLIQLEATLLSTETNVKQYKEHIKHLEEEIEKSKQDNSKLLQDSGSVYTELNAKVSSLESKYNALLEEKEKLAKEELSTRDAKKGLEQVRDSLLKEKAEQLDIVKDREAKLENLQREVSRMSEQFLQHKQDLQQKLDVSKAELQATLELKNQLEIQHGVLEELQQNLQNSEDARKHLEIKCQSISTTSAEKDELQKQLEKLEKSIMEKDNRISEVENQASELTNMLGKSQHLLHQKEAEFENANKQLRSAQAEISDTDKLKARIKSLDDEKLSLKNKIRNLEESQAESRTTKNSNVANAEKEATEDEDKEFLRSQVDFLNSIIVEMKQKNEELGNQLELQSTCWEEADINLNTKKQLAPRLFCDICDVFDLHDTDDCPKQESMLEEDIPPVKVKSSKTVKERPYCNNCEVFGHWTLDCDEQDTF